MLGLMVRGWEWGVLLLLLMLLLVALVRVLRVVALLLPLLLPLVLLPALLCLLGPCSQAEGALLPAVWSPVWLEWSVDIHVCSPFATCRVVVITVHGAVGNVNVHGGRRRGLLYVTHDGCQRCEQFTAGRSRWSSRRVCGGSQCGGEGGRYCRSGAARARGNLMMKA